ncbi:MAG: HIT domain-containing protein [Candidatus Diapherotrites archaeon]|nr:HIT domain-containing protein [Candidatus Diapherotrites archaeon]
MIDWMEKECIFCSIVLGKIPCIKLFENESAIALLDIAPLSIGHALVVPKVHSKNLLSVAKKDFEGILSAIQMVGSAQFNALKTDGFNVLQSNNPAAGQVISHTHFHVIPRKENDGLKFGWPSKKAGEKELKETQKLLLMHLK